MFVGEYRHTIDDKARLTIPSKFRAEFEAGLYITCGLDQCLWVFTREGWDRFSEKLASLPSGLANTRTITRFFFSQASNEIPDRQGRIVVPENLKHFANLEDGATIIGANDKVEIWLPERWESFKAEQQANLAAIAEELSSFGI
ncbi:MAG TPA: division/cell wall cluster transcriptional repressor MraZ [Ardenticatenaceae bacterium]|jgi:MraZ protein